MKEERQHIRRLLNRVKRSSPFITMSPAVQRAAIFEPQKSVVDDRTTRRRIRISFFGMKQAARGLKA
ncbi:MAG: hypothetical protein HPY58_10235 [Firmicutes bacterium]|nr:hypothetical protein [Bacillota bacterium]